MYYNPSVTSFIGVCGIIGGINMFLSLLTWPLVAIFFPRRFDPQYKTLFKGAMGLGRFWRGGWYATAMIGKGIQRKGSVNDQIFKGTDLWSQATQFEKWLACIYGYSLYITLLMAIIFGIGHAIFWFRHTFF